MYASPVLLVAEVDRSVAAVESKEVKVVPVAARMEDEVHEVGRCVPKVRMYAAARILVAEVEGAVVCARVDRLEHAPVAPAASVTEHQIDIVRVCLATLWLYTPPGILP